MIRLRLFILGLVVCALGGVAAATEEAEAAPSALKTGPSPRVFYTRPGQFEIILMDAADARRVLVLGRAVWAALTEPLRLPADGFNTPVSVRLVPAAQWSGLTDFTVTVATPGLVTVRVRWEAGVDPKVVRRALVHGLLMRQAASWYGTTSSITVPLWLEYACADLSRAKERPAIMDMFQQDSVRLVSAPSLASVLQWERGAGESRERELAALWLLLQLQAESIDGTQWQQWLRGVLGGAKAQDTLPRIYTGLWANAADMELWWQTGFYHQAKKRILPVMTASESRAWVADRSRWLGVRQGLERVVPLDELPRLHREPWVRRELGERIQQLHLTLPAIHPFYANAMVSLGRLYEAAQKGKQSAAKVALGQFERDAMDARELDDTVGAILDTAPRQ